MSWTWNFVLINYHYVLNLLVEVEVNEEEDGMVVIGGGAAGHTAVETLRSAQVLRDIVHNSNDIVHHH